MDPQKIRNILNILFMIGTLIAIIVYFAAAIFIKIMEFFIRFTNR